MFGKVENVLEGMEAAFIDIGLEKNTFIHAKDIMPKVDITKEKVKNVNIKELAKTGMKLLVQIKKEETNKKGARVSTHISIPGRYIVLMPNVEFVTVSQKIEDMRRKKKVKRTNNKGIATKYGCYNKDISKK